MAIDYKVFYFKRGAAYRASKVIKKSAYFLPIDTTPGRPAGYSRIHGDASHEVQRKVIDALIEAAKKEKFSIRRMAMLLAMAGMESGFNPDAAAGTTTASGIGQFIDGTGMGYGLTPKTRFEIGPSVKALIAYFKVNEKLAKKNGKPDHWVYKYHHDGPTLDYGGGKLADEIFLPLVKTYEKALTAGHVISVIDPHGEPIADAHVKVAQGGKEAVLKTDENGRLPSFLANPDFGPISIFIKKLDDSFKALGQLPIEKHSSAWTVVAPKDRKKIKTHLHEPVSTGCPPGSNTHKVRSGETVSLIARLHGTTYQEICKLNGIEKPYTIYPDQILKVPQKKTRNGDGASAKPRQQHAPSSPAPADAPAPKAVQGPSPAANAPAAAPASANPGVRNAPMATPSVAGHRPGAHDQPGGHGAPAATPGMPAREQAAKVPEPLPAKPIVSEQRDQQSKHPVANVIASAPSDKMAAAIAYALKHKEPSTTHFCLRYVKRALFATKLIRYYNNCEYAKEFAPYLEEAGFENILVTRPNTNIANAPIGAIIIYRPVEMQTFKGKIIAGHIEIKTKVGYVSDYLSPGPTYSTNPVTMVSPVGRKIPVSYKVTGIYIKE